MFPANLPDFQSPGVPSEGILENWGLAMFTQWLLYGPVQCSVGIKQTQTSSWSFPPASSEDRGYRHTGALQTDIRSAVQPAPGDG